MTSVVKTEHIERDYENAKEQYALLGIDTDAVLATLAEVQISLQCWQGDDVGGFETPDAELSGGGIQTTGNYPGKARTADELRQDLAKVFSLLPGSHRLSLHAIYADLGGARVDRDELEAKHFGQWMAWAKEQGVKLDFNTTFFSHPKADDGKTLSHPDESVRQFWIAHGIACRKIAEAMGKEQGGACILNHWIPDGEKDLPADRWAPRARLKESFDKIFASDVDENCVKESVECKLFGIGSESYVVGSHEFYLAYALTRNKMICLDTGHFHPTEEVADKLSAVLTFFEEILLHISRGVRWDSDHVVILNDEVRAIAEELVRGQALSRVHLGLDFFDASINRLAAWIIGTRSVLKALLIALLQPTDQLQDAERLGDSSLRLAMMEDLKNMPFGAVWNYHCQRQGVPAGLDWITEVKAYEEAVLSTRG